MFFKPREVKWCLAALEAKIAQNADLSDPELVRQTKERLSDRTKTIASIRDDGLSPETVATLVLSNVAGNMLTMGSGLYAYRGILTLRGQSVLRAFDYCSDELVKFGVSTAEEAEEDKRWIRSEVKDVG